MASEFSGEVSMQIPETGIPCAPVIQSATREGNTVNLAVAIPATSEDGNPLAALSELEVHADTKTLLGRVEELLGMDPKVKVALTLAQAGQVVTVQVPNLAWGAKWYFTARVS